MYRGNYWYRPVPVFLYIEIFNVYINLHCIINVLLPVGGVILSRYKTTG
jgi:hypothetical protein